MLENYKYSFSENFIDAENNNSNEFAGMLTRIPFVGYTVGTSTAPITYDTRTINTGDIDLSFINEGPGSYTIYIGYEIQYNNQSIATITSDPVPYVKH